MNEIETFYGLIESTADALRVFELCRKGVLGRVRRRLHERERRMIRSGSVFVFNEYESGIKRWTDGRLWSPSRIFGDFLLYRELDSKKNNDPDYFDELEQKQDQKDPFWGNPAVPSQVREWVEARSQLLDNKFRGSTLEIRSHHHSRSCPSMEYDYCQKRKLFRFREDGLIKKTISITMDGQVHHLVCYYSKKDFTLGKLSRSFNDVLQMKLAEVYIPADLVLHQNFRKSNLTFPINVPEAPMTRQHLEYNQYNQEAHDHRRSRSVSMSSLDSANFFKQDYDQCFFQHPPFEPYRADMGPSLLVPGTRPRSMSISSASQPIIMPPEIFLKSADPSVFTPPISSDAEPKDEQKSPLTALQEFMGKDMNPAMDDLADLIPHPISQEPDDLSQAPTSYSCEAHILEDPLGWTSPLQ